MYRAIDSVNKQVLGQRYQITMRGNEFVGEQCQSHFLAR